jgi:hypothetical protein
VLFTAALFIVFVCISAGAPPIVSSHLPFLAMSAANATATDASAHSAAAALPEFLPLPFPPVDAAPFPTMNDVTRVQANARAARSAPENRFVALKRRVVLGVFAAAVVLLPLLAYALRPTPPPVQPRPSAPFPSPAALQVANIQQL